MKKSFVFWRKPTGDPITDGFSRNPEYHEFFNKCNQFFEFRFADNPESYLGQGVFKNVSKYQHGRILSDELRFKADVVYQFSKMPIDSFDGAIKMINSLEFRWWCGDKWNQYQLLNEYMSKTFLVENNEDYRQALEKIMTKRAIVKPKNGQKGEGVIAFDTINPPELDPEVLKNRKYLLQEFADTNVHIKGVLSGVHDIKLITLGDSVYANIRTPHDRGDVCTYDSKYDEFPLERLPAEVLAFHKKVKAKVDQKYPGQIYTIDVGLTKDGPVVFELNAHTAFPYIHFAYAEDFLNRLVGILNA